MLAVTASLLLGGRLALDTWKKQEDFYPLQLVVLGFLTLMYARVLLRDLAGLSWSTNAEEAKWKKGKARHLMAYIFGTMLMCFCFGVCLVAARVFGKLYIVAAVGSGILMLWMVLRTDREIRRLASCFFSPRNESLSQVVGSSSG